MMDDSRLAKIIKNGNPNSRPAKRCCETSTELDINRTGILAKIKKHRRSTRRRRRSS
jgi:hypothetical protein